ncbi:TetR/AcrR family transcriptional regulator [Nonomuraea sp. NPDC050153]|uniref:TetR/AcrR family transcriptional regulator n=1 Tax=Nonomuraea sp. NPDC050153 TaxID=3364359 RepID=UPI0037ADA90E
MLSELPAGIGTSRRQEALDEFVQKLESDNWTGMTAAKRRVLEAFLQLCIRHGMESVSMRTLAKELNIKPPSIYSHFPEGRDEIVAECLRWHFHQFGRALCEAVTDAADAPEFWDAMVRLHFTRQVRLPESNLWDLLVDTDRMVHMLPTDLSEQVMYWIDLYEALFKAAALDMGFPDAERRIKVVMTVLEGSTRWFAPDSSDAELAVGADQAVLISHALLNLPL